MKSLFLQSQIAIRLIWQRLVKATLTRPTFQDWRLALGLLLAYAVVVVPLGFSSGLIQFTPAEITTSASVLLAVRVLIFPAMVEEVLWRVLLLPHKSEPISDRRRWLLGLPILALFVLMHPLNSITYYPAAFNVFTHPIFLLATTLLGLICMVAYWRSGSGWVSVALHWSVVYSWLLLFGGYGQLHA